MAGNFCICRIVTQSSYKESGHTGNHGSLHYPTATVESRWCPRDATPYFRSRLGDPPASAPSAVVKLAAGCQATPGRNIHNPRHTRIGAFIKKGKEIFLIFKRGTQPAYGCLIDLLERSTNSLTAPNRRISDIKVSAMSAHPCRTPLHTERNTNV